MVALVDGSRVVRLTVVGDAGTLAECVELNGPCETELTSSGNGERNNESASRPTVPAVTRDSNPDGALLPASAAPVIGDVRDDAAPAFIRAIELVDVVDRAPAERKVIARETDRRCDGDEIAATGHDIGWWIVNLVAAPGRSDVVL
jgi:hypothetical protein